MFSTPHTHLLQLHHEYKMTFQFSFPCCDVVLAYQISFFIHFPFLSHFIFQNEEMQISKEQDKVVHVNVVMSYGRKVCVVDYLSFIFVRLLYAKVLALLGNHQIWRFFFFLFNGMQINTNPVAKKYGKSTSQNK